MRHYETEADHPNEGIFKVGGGVEWNAIFVVADSAARFELQWIHQAELSSFSNGEQKGFYELAGRKFFVKDVNDYGLEVVVDILHLQFIGGFKVRDCDLKLPCRVNNPVILATIESYLNFAVIQYVSLAVNSP